MKVCLVWHECPMSNGSWRHDPITAFWVAATEEEAREFFVDKLSKEHLEEFEKACEDEDYMDGWYRGHRDCLVGFSQPSEDDNLKMIIVSKSQFGGESPPKDNLFRFLVTQDLSRVDLGFAVYPYSGMWNGDSPFEKFEKKISNPEELMNLL